MAHKFSLAVHFAEALVAEAMGVDVNWAEFAFTQTHTHERHIPVPRLLPEFEGLMEPLTPLKKVIPFENFTVSFELFG